MSTSAYHNIFEWISEQSESFIDRLYGATLLDSGTNLESISNSNKEQGPNVHLYVEKIPSDEAIFACRAIFQSLSPLSKIYVMRLCLLETISSDDMLPWVKSSHLVEHHATIIELNRFRILIQSNPDLRSQSKSSSVTYFVNKCFRSSFLKGITFPAKPWSKTIDQVDKRLMVSGVDIEFKANEKWNNILKFLMNIKNSASELKQNQPFGLSRSISEFLRNHMKLLTEQNSLTSLGYEFMLKDYHSQIWELIWRITEYSPNHEESVSLLFMLSYCEANCAYPMTQMTKVQIQILIACRDIGIIHVDKEHNLFYPTKAAINLVFKTNSKNHQENSSMEVSEGAFTADIGGDSTGYGDNLESVSFVKLNELRIIVETNMQVIGYITNDLHVALLKLFIDINVRLPNMVIGYITRNKAKEAFRVGITVSQIVDFLSSHAHNVLVRHSQLNNRNIMESYHNKLLIPNNVIDQLILWSDEDNRIKEVEAEEISFDQGQVTTEMFHEFESYMKRLNALLWSNESSLQMVVTTIGYEHLISLLGDHSMLMT